MLVDLNTFIRPRLFVMDGVLAMEGNGPFGGKQRRMNVLLFSTDPVALDAIACKMIDLNPEFVPTSKPGEKSGLGFIIIPRLSYRRLPGRIYREGFQGHPQAAGPGDRQQNRRFYSKPAHTQAGYRSN